MKQKYLVIVISLLLLGGVLYWFYNNNMTTSVTSQDSVLVESFPSFPIHPSAQIITSSEIKEPGEKAYQAELVSETSAIELYNWYKDELSHQGWDVEETSVDEEYVDFYMSATNEPQQVFIDFNNENPEQTHLSIRIFMD